MAANRSSVRFVVLGFIIVAISALSVVAETGWGGNIFGSIQQLFAPASSSLTRAAESGIRGDRNENNAEALFNGAVIFQRGAVIFDPPYYRGAQLYKIDPNTGTETFFGDGSQPNYSFEGSKIVFENGDTQIATTPADSYTPTGLTNFDNGAPIRGFYPRWSPDSANIAYNLSQSVFGSFFYHIKILRGDCSACSIRQELDEFGANSKIYPAWHPVVVKQGTSRTARLLFVQTSANRDTVDGGSYTGDIFAEPITIAQDGAVTEGSRVNLTNSPATYSFPSYSHDGTKITFVKSVGSGSDQNDSLWVMDANGPNSAPILSTGGQLVQILHPAWSPDDSKIVFADFYQLYQITASTHQMSEVTISPTYYYDRFPSWAPGSAPSATLSFDGFSSDRVSRHHGGAGLVGDGDPDGAFTVALPTSATGKTVKSIDLCQTATPCSALPVNSVVPRWNTIPSDANSWVLGVDYSPPGSSLLNNLSTGSLEGENRPVSSNGLFKLYIGDTIPSSLLFGRQFTVVVTLSDGTTAVATTRINSTQADISIGFEQPPPISITVGDTYTLPLLITNSGPEVAHGVALRAALLGPLNNVSVVNSADCQVVGLIRVICNIGDIQPGSSASVKIVAHAATPGSDTNEFLVDLDETKTFEPNTENNFRVNGATINPLVVPATLSFDGRLRDRVNRHHGDAGIDPDGDFDPTFTLTLPSAVPVGKSLKSIDLCQKSTPCLPLPQDSGINRWDTIAADTSLWLLGVDYLPESPALLNKSGTDFNGSVEGVTVSSQRTFRLYVGDAIPTAFVPGSKFSVTLTFDDGSLATATTTVGNVPTADLGLYMRAENQTGGALNNSIAAGQTYRYHPQVTNYGPLPATGVVFSINLPQGVDFTGNDGSNLGVCSQASSGSPVLCKITSAIPVGNTLGVIFNVKANQAGTFNTTAVVYSDMSEPQPDPHPNTFSVTTTTNSAADLSVRVTGDGDPVQVDAPLIYTITVKNNGPLDAPNTLARLTYDGDAAYQRYQGTSRNCLEQGTSRQIICTIGTLSPGAETALTIQVRPKNLPGNADHMIGLFVNATGDLFDYDVANNNVTFKTTVVPNSPPINDPFPSNLSQINNYVLPGMPGTVDGSTSMQGTVKGTNVGAGRQTPIYYDKNGEVYHAGAEAGKSVWYVWTGPPDGSGSVEFSTGGTSFDASRSTFNTLLEVYDIALADGSVSPVSVASNNDVTAGDVTSRVRVTFKPGHFYVIAVDGYRGATGFVALHWNVTLQAVPQIVPQEITSIFPVIGCSRDSDQTTKFCKASYDAATGYHILHILGTGLTDASRARINNTNLAGFDLNGQPINGFTEQVRDANGNVTELVAHMPPSPVFDSVSNNKVNVETPVSSSKSAGADGTSSYFSSNTATLPVVTLKNATIPAHESRTACSHLDFLGGDETCIEFYNDGIVGMQTDQPVTVDPTYFEVFAYCRTLFPGNDAASFDQRRQCSASNGYGAEKLAQQLGKAFAMNPSKALENDIIRMTPTVNVPPEALLASMSGVGLGAQIVVQPAKLISQDGSTVLPNDGATLIAQDGSSVVSNDGGTLKVVDLDKDLLGHPDAIVAAGGGNLVSHDGGSLVSHDGGSRPALISPVGVMAADDLKKGSGGWFLVRSSGNTNPVYTGTTNDDGSTSGKLTVTFDANSTPRVQDLQGLAFAVALNPAVVKFDANQISTSGSVATFDLTRIGDTSVPVSVEYTTVDGSAKAGIDYQAKTGNLFFATGETHKQISITLISTSPAQRTFNLIIGNAQGGAIMMPNMGTVTMLPNQTSATDSGRVLTSDGRGLKNATVSIADSNGVIRRATTNSFGFYSFDSVAKSGTYTFRVFSKLYRFTPRTLQISDNISNLDFTGLE